MGVPERMILLGVLRTPNIVDVLLLADLRRWPIIYSATNTNGSAHEILAFIGDDEPNRWAK
jgi:hypothetical protein